VSPNDNLVAVRMISGNSYKDEKDGFIDFENMVVGLSKP
jgi:hypothetical protein